MANEPKPPKIPSVGEKLGQLDQWVSSEDPYEGRFVDKDDNGTREHADQ